MRIPAIVATSRVIARCDSTSAAAPSAVDTGSPIAGATRQAASPIADGASANLAGFSFLNSSVSGKGSRFKLSPRTSLYPRGSMITGIDGCSTTPYSTDGLLDAVIDYTVRPTADHPEPEPRLDIEQVSASSQAAGTCYSYESAPLNGSVDDYGTGGTPGWAHPAIVV